VVSCAARLPSKRLLRPRLPREAAGTPLAPTRTKTTGRTCCASPQRTHSGATCSRCGATGRSAARARRRTGAAVSLYGESLLLSSEGGSQSPLTDLSVSAGGWGAAPRGGAGRATTGRLGGRSRRGSWTSSGPAGGRRASGRATAARPGAGAAPTTVRQRAPSDLLPMSGAPAAPALLLLLLLLPPPPGLVRGRDAANPMWALAAAAARGAACALVVVERFCGAGHLWPQGVTPTPSRCSWSPPRARPPCCCRAGSIRGGCACVPHRRRRPARRRAAAAAAVVSVEAQAPIAREGRCYRGWAGCWVVGASAAAAAMGGAAVGAWVYAAAAAASARSVARCVAVRWAKVGVAEEPRDSSSRLHR
jgi:hypothetical protein